MRHGCLLAAVCKQALAAAVLAMLVAGQHQAAEAQSRRYPPVPRDADADAELHSNLWERVLHPNQTRYEQRVRRAERLLGQRDDQAHQEALATLQSAIELAPAAPEAHWLMGLVHEQSGHWAACGAAYDKVFTVAPDYQPALVPGERKAAWALDFALALCHAQAGAYERAIDHYKRILSRGHTSDAVIHRHLGQTYMALGRLAEAIDALRTALRQNPQHVRTHYALAVAHDRNEQPAEARRYLDSARRYDRGLGHLDDPREEIIPAGDVLYYWALAHENAGNRAWAVAYLRHYLHDAGAGPWARRARAHLSLLAADLAPASAVDIEGALDRDAATAAVARADQALQACVRQVPRVLFEVRVTEIAQASTRAAAGRPGGPARGVKAQVLYAAATEVEAQSQAQRCLEAVAEGIDLPRPGSGDRRYAGVRFPVIAPAVSPP